MANTVGILLPVRLETRFDQDAAGDWQLRLRIIPDEPAIDRQRDSVSADEWVSVSQFWQAIATAPLAPGSSTIVWFSSPTATTAWEHLCQQVSPPRAAWLVSAFQPAVNAAGMPELEDPPLLGQPADHNIVRGFPDSYDVWAVFGNNPPVRLAEVTVPNPREIPLRPPEPDVNGEAKEEWWNSWRAALDLKLAVQCPLQGDPAELRVLLVVGLAKERPATLFRRKTASGELAILEPGLPTNTSRGDPAAPLHDQPHDWFDLVRGRLTGNLPSALESISVSLTGKPDALLRVPGDDTRFPEPGPSLVQGLWSALWGHALRDVGGLPTAAENLGMWAQGFLRPEGPLPPIRIRNQPYGLLPVTAFRNWQPDPLDATFGPTEKELLGRLLPVRDSLESAALARGNAVGADTQGLLDVLGRDGVTHDYGYRDLLPRELAEAIQKLKFAMAGMTYDPAKFEDWLKATGFFAIPGWHPDHFLIADGDWHLLKLPLVQGKMPFSLGELVQRLDFPDAFTNFVVERLERVLPNSLLVRLMLWSSWLNKAAVVLQSGAEPPGVLTNPALLFEPPIVSDRTINLVSYTAEETEFDRLKTHWGPAPGPGTPAHRILRMMDRGFAEISKWFDDPQADQARLEQAFRAALDATYRIDPWLVGVAWHRLQTISTTASFQLGIYGWVEGPIRGEPGPTAGGWLHAPSQRQALTAAILRDKFLSQQTAADGRNTWHMDLASQPVRLADQMAEEVRIGAHLWEVVGRQVERIVGTRDGVTLLRVTYAQDPLHPDPNVVCHGPNALKGLLSAPPPALAPTAAQRLELQGLDAALDAYGDLLVSEAVYRVVNGQAEAAGAAMDAAIGLQRPPSLDLIHTPRTGRSLSTTVLSRLPAVDPPADAEVTAESSPGALADPSVAQFLIDYWGDATTWIVVANEQRVSLADIGLQPIDAVVLPAQTFAELMNAALETDLATPAAGASTNALKRQVQARELVQNLGRHPALGRDFLTEPLTDADAAAADALDAGIRDQFYVRLNQVRQAATLLSARLTAAATPADLLSALRLALGWGLVPQLSNDERPAFFTGLLAPPPDAAFLTRFGDRLPEMAQSAALGLTKRLQTVSDEPTLRAARTDAGRIAAAVSQLAAPTGQLAVLGVIDGPRLDAISGLVAAPDPALQSDWLPVVAAVRPSLARLEAWILEQEIGGATSLASWSSAPGDHWLTAFLQANPSVSVSEARFPRLVTAYGPANAAQAPKVAAGVIDAWSETVPRLDQSTSVAFGFNAPGARAPQSILLAVPPLLDQPLDAETLRDVILETRSLTLARAATFDDLAQYEALAPTLVFPSRGTTAVRTSPEFKWPVPD